MQARALSFGLGSSCINKSQTASLGHLLIDLQDLQDYRTSVAYKLDWVYIIPKKLQQTIYSRTCKPSLNTLPQFHCCEWHFVLPAPLGAFMVEMTYPRPTLSLPVVRSVANKRWRSRQWECQAYQSEPTNDLPEYYTGPTPFIGHQKNNFEVF